ncbi:MAG: 3-phosphoshikimate 1-carboxyvinyltransferase, partial [Paludibacteraceae bacterium]|nr:3-phosphoshikimate 1-carboxyvinyltransferase [Paludibacteraceae bacterium]
MSKQSLPASKSISNRILIMNALANGGGRVSNLAKCDDTDVLVAALSAEDSVF